VLGASTGGLFTEVRGIGILRSSQKKIVKKVVINTAIE
jgi:hypothetical protein